MSDALLTLLQWCLLALIYLFFLRVLQATWYGAVAGMRAPGPQQTAGGTKRRRRGRRASQSAATPAAGSSGPPAFAVLGPEPLAGTRFLLAPETTIGRAAGCTISLEDTYASQLHARAILSPDGVVLEDLGSTNGTYCNRQRISVPTLLRAGDIVQIGGTVMELQL